MADQRTAPVKHEHRLRAGSNGSCGACARKEGSCLPYFPLGLDARVMIHLCERCLVHAQHALHGQRVTKLDMVILGMVLTVITRLVRQRATSMTDSGQEAPPATTAVHG